MHTLVDTWDTEPTQTLEKKVRAVSKRLDPMLTLKVLEAFDAGISPTRIAKKYNTTPAAIRNRIRASGREVRKCVCPRCGFDLLKGEQNENQT